MGWLHKLSRKKNIDSIPLDTSLQRCLSTFDLTLMGVGSMVGSGIYIMTGVAAKELAGPSIVLSFVAAGLIAVLAAVCFTEFAARVPRTGGAYLFMYASLGEFPAFIMGWAMLIAIVNGGATNARAWSAYLDFLLDNAISNFTETRIADWKIGEPISEYPDFMAAVIILLLTAVVISGANCSSKFMSAVALINVAVLVFVISVGLAYADPHNWFGAETGGFFSFGWSGVLAGTGACFWAFTGFEIIGNCSEEAKDPKTSIPIATGLAILLVALLYIGTVSSVTLLCPYPALDAEAPLPSAFDFRGVHWAGYVVAVGPLAGLTTTLFSSIFIFARACYAMAEDGLIWPVCGQVTPCSGVPMAPAVVGSVLMCLQAVFLDIRHILGFGVLLSLFQFTLISASVILLRYRPAEITRTHGSDDAEVMTPGSTGGVAQNILNGDVHLASPRQDDNAAAAGDADDSMQQSAHSSILDMTDDHVDSESTKLLARSDMQLAPMAHDEDMTTQREQRNGRKKRKHRKGGKNTHNGIANGSTPPVAAGDVDPSGRLKPRVPSCLRRALNFGPGVWVAVAVTIMWVLMVLLSTALIYGRTEMEQHAWWSVATMVAIAAILALLYISIILHQQNTTPLKFKVPLVPLLPLLSILFSTILMVATATVISWVGFGIVFILGVVVYFAYGIHHSKMNDGCFELLPLTSVGSSLLGSEDSEDESLG